MGKVCLVELHLYIFSSRSYWIWDPQVLALTRSYLLPASGKIPNANALVSLTTSIFSLDGWCGLVRPTNHLATCWDIKRYAKIHISLFSLLLFHVSVIKCLTFLDRMNSLCTNDVRCMFSTSSSPILCYSSLTQHNLRASFRSSMFSVIISRSVRNDRVSSKRTEGLNTTSSCDSGADQG